MLRRRFLFAKKAVASGISDNEIWYTTTDGVKLSSSTNSAFEDDALSSNTYIGGVGKLVYLNVITTIGLNMFRKCTSLQTMVLPSSVESIGNYAYNGCTGLTSIEIPNSVTLLGNEAFSGCTNLSSISLPSNLKNLGNYVFLNCTALKSIDIPSTVTQIGNEAFSGCSALSGVRISDLEAWCKISFAGYRSNPLYYGKKLYLNNSLVTNLAIPSGITTIKQYAFRACESITSVTFPNSVTSIADYAFMHCTSLTNVVIPDNVSSIGGSSFEATTTTSLTELTIGSGVSSIGQNTFKNQTKLTTIYCNSSTPPTIQSNTFEGVPTSCVVYVPSASVSAYQSATYWSNLTIQGEEQSGGAIRLYYEYCEDWGLSGTCYRAADATTIELYNRLKDIINTYGNPINPMDYGLELYIEDDLITSAFDENSFIYLTGEGDEYGELFSDGRLLKEY